MAKIILSNLTDAQASAIATSLDNEDGSSIIDSINDILSDSKLPFIVVDTVKYDVDATGASRHVITTKPLTIDLDEPSIEEDVDDIVDADTDTFGFDDVDEEEE
jgi:predicted metalloprotease with PDZ domain